MIKRGPIPLAASFFQVVRKNESATANRHGFADDAIEIGANAIGTALRIGVAAFAFGKTGGALGRICLGKPRLN